jgi:hypothetical protein
MVKDPRQYASTGGWATVTLTTEIRFYETVLKTCFPFHEAIAIRNVVFTRYLPWRRPCGRSFSRAR